MGWEEGGRRKRLEVEGEMGREAEENGGTGDHGGDNSLRVGGASALWAAFGDSGLVKRWGRWASDCFHGYLWDSREGSRGVAAAMTTADLTPV